MSAPAAAAAAVGPAVPPAGLAAPLAAAMAALTRALCLHCYCWAPRQQVRAAAGQAAAAHGAGAPGRHPLAAPQTCKRQQV